jgi:hypothetical protein
VIEHLRPHVPHNRPENKRDSVYYLIGEIAKNDSDGMEWVISKM